MFEDRCDEMELEDAGLGAAGRRVPRFINDEVAEGVEVDVDEVAEGIDVNEVAEGVEVDVDKVAEGVEVDVDDENGDG
jgi:hypothetical protein